MNVSHEQLKRTALNNAHRQLGARMIDFGGWDMPVTYAGTIDEHMAVRTGAGLFDVSHMGEIEVRGAQALALVQHITTNDASKLQIGQAQYAGLTTPQGTFVDDLLVHKLSDEHYFLCVNASNTDKDFQWIVDNTKEFDAEVENTSGKYTQIALQGPRALEILQPFTNVDLGAIKYYWFANGTIDGVPAIIARTGYTGEDGFELYIDPNASEQIWNGLLEAGKPVGIQPCGLAARNTLRLEAKMALYGNDIDDTTTVYEADLAWIVKLNKGDFIGRDALARQKEQGLTRKLVGFEMIERGIGRDHYPILIAGQQVSQVSSGSPAPYLKKNIGLAYLPMSHVAIGSQFQIDVRGKLTAAQVVATPFYKRSA
ncbi:MAG: glycine cleavage system aminomethyltransferase GcvT [Acidobacteria bacterium]|nr:glycine cleavage system aminomethyltransferase GcvT [Acidobacteriota bacterium]